MASPLKSVSPGPIFLAGWQNQELSPSGMGFLFPLVWTRSGVNPPEMNFLVEIGNAQSRLELARGYTPFNGGERWLSQSSLWFYTTDGYLATRDFVSNEMFYVQKMTRQLTVNKSEASRITFTWNMTTKAMEIKSSYHYLQWTSSHIEGGKVSRLYVAGLQWVTALEPVAADSRADSWTVFSYNTPTTLELPVSPCQSIGKALGGSIEGCALGPWFNGSCRVAQLGPSGIGLPFLDVAYWPAPTGVYVLFTAPSSIDGHPQYLRVAGDTATMNRHLELKIQEYDTTTGKLRVTERAGQIYYDAEAQTLDWMPNKLSTTRWTLQPPDVMLAGWEGGGGPLPVVLALRECDLYDQTFTEAGVKCVPQPVLAGAHFRIGFLSSTERQGLVVQHIETGFCLRFPDLTWGPCGDKENAHWSRGQNGATDSAEISASLYYPGGSPEDRAFAVGRQVCPRSNTAARAVGTPEDRRAACCSGRALRLAIPHRYPGEGLADWHKNGDSNAVIVLISTDTNYTPPTPTSAQKLYVVLTGTFRHSGELATITPRWMQQVLTVDARKIGSLLYVFCSIQETPTSAGLLQSLPDLRFNYDYLSKNNAANAKGPFAQLLVHEFSYDATVCDSTWCPFAERHCRTPNPDNPRQMGTR